MKLLTAPWVVPVASPPVEGGAVALEEATGRITQAGPLDALRREYPYAQVEAFDDVALLPALVNAHTHLELTRLGDPPDGLAFADWIVEVIARKRAATQEDFRGGLRVGAEACLRAGQGTVVDVLSAPGCSDGYPDAELRLLAQPELICPADTAAAELAGRAARLTVSGCAVLAGVFAHTPFTAGAEAYRQAHAASRAAGHSFFTHLAESPDEVRFCLTGDGPIRDILYGALPPEVQPPEPPGMHPFDWLENLGVLGPGTVLVHAVQLDESRIARLAGAGAGVVLCPRSNRALGVGDAPGRALLDAGVVVGLGTDSRLSAGDLDLWADLRAAVDIYGWSPEKALEAATRGGAQLAGLGEEIGAFAPGFSADILARKLGDGADLWERLLTGAGVAALWRSGRRLI